MRFRMSKLIASIAIMITSFFGTADVWGQQKLSDYGAKLKSPAVGGQISLPTRKTPVLKPQSNPVPLQATLGTRRISAGVIVYSFIVSDTVKWYYVAKPGEVVQWTIVGKGAAANVSGFNTLDGTSTADASGVATYDVKLSNNQQLVTDRYKNWQNGSKSAPNTAISYDITAKTASQSGTTTLTQNETSILRQEYFDYKVIPIPEYSEFVQSLGGGFNRGNYGVQLSNNLDTRYNAILAAYRGRAITVLYGKKDKYPSTIPNTATLTISSGYRNPQRNKAEGSKYTTTSRHVVGRALDLVPDATTVTIMVKGVPVEVPIAFNGPLFHSALYPALGTAAGTQGAAIAEDGSKPVVPIGNKKENHIHVQWEK